MGGGTQPALAHSTVAEPVSAVGLSKRYGHVRALSDVSFGVAAGEILAVVGDNGAGKSTLLKLVTGVETPDGGELFLSDRRVTFASPTDARQAGVAAVYQDLALVECLDVATNVFLGQMPRRGPFVDRRRMDTETKDLMAALSVRIGSPRTPVGLLPGGYRQAIAIARALRTDARVLVMDEPTAALGVGERALVVDVIRGLRDDGRAVIIVSHDLDVVFALADRIQVLRLGRTAGVLERERTDRDEVIGLITGVAP
jgi:ABC-type sugar transport system ATPase subunit